MALRKLFKTGGCVALAIPKQFRAALRLQAGSPVVVTLKDRALTVTPAIITPLNLMSDPEAAPSAPSSPKE